MADDISTLARKEKKTWKNYGITRLYRHAPWASPLCSAKTFRLTSASQPPHIEQGAAEPE